MMESLQLSTKKTFLFLAAALALLVWTVLMPVRVTAAEVDSETTTTASTSRTDEVYMSTDYPGISVRPGETTTFSLYFTNSGDTEMDMALSASNLPEGWSGYFRGSSSEVSSVHVYGGQTKDDSPTLSYSLTIPEETEEGQYEIELSAQSDTVTVTLPLTINVALEESGQGNFTAEYPEQQGATGTSFSFNTTLVNNGASAKTYSLSAEAPEGWQVTFSTSSDSTQVASVPVDAGGSEGLTVAVTPSENVESGDYTINCTAVSSDETLNLELQVTITGTYGVVLTTPSGNLSLNAYANEETPVTLSIQNTGNVDLNNLQLSSSASTDWNVRFDETTIDTLEAGATKEVTAYIQPSEDAIIGDYVTAITVRNDQASSEMDLRVSVQNHTTWGIVAVVIIVVLCVGLGLIIRKYGRR